MNGSEREMTTGATTILGFAYQSAPTPGSRYRYDEHHRRSIRQASRFRAAASIGSADTPTTIMAAETILFQQQLLGMRAAAPNAAAIYEAYDRPVNLDPWS